MENFFSQYPFLLSLLVSEGVLLLAKNKDLKILFKNHEQRTAQEKKYIKQGLKKSLIVDILLIPISLFILYFLVFIPLREKIYGISQNVLFSHSVLGLIAYGFPFATVKKLVQEITLSTLKKLCQNSR